ncbi:Ubiquitin- modifier 1 [Coemansia sp. RSA 989]|nr:ubiquitin-like modifier 1 [Coemansia mojavensis]KAJ1740817.1 Ubiquitin- modifier 1 [Coemansia sp. RSA 1086]KAJ1748694.1 Ubiquitin- modifier 1 [Coemansia sp. RSA 1821]KAJ1864483.1 Ubiquitin- modifier 1 [Coemansia sp. RSA 989]KAJ1873642.1 Ubiquitin- modifier 1 [Coemansia sp. RSA 990]KAJ2631248.1 Ubiquitin- modifier 1 [Coemansia sp. RSA 1290]KAJ2648844.1 Ubiquitin- modifier 1 [Coemansia sp. RSA 1250]
MADTEKQTPKLLINVEFSDGLETLIKDEVLKKEQGRNCAQIKLEETYGGKPATIRHLAEYIRDNCIKAKPELFYDKDGVRPGILVLINNDDWELFEENGVDRHDYKLENNASVVFISTLHGG